MQAKHTGVHAAQATQAFLCQIPGLESPCTLPAAIRPCLGLYDWTSQPAAAPARTCMRLPEDDLRSEMPQSLSCPEPLLLLLACACHMPHS